MVQRPIHRDEPLRRPTPDHRGLGPPRVRITQRRDAPRQQRARLDQLVHHRLVRRPILSALLAVDRDDLEPLKTGTDIRVAPELVDSVRDRDVDAFSLKPLGIRHPDFVVILAMARRGVNKARARIVRNMCPSKHRDIEAVALTCKRVRQRHVLKHGSVDITDTLPAAGLSGLHHALGELVCDDQLVARLDPWLERKTLLERFALIQAVGDLRIERDCAVCGYRPRRSRPYHHARVAKLQAGLRLCGFHKHTSNRKLHPDHLRLAVSVLDLRFRKRGLLNRAPHHRLRAALELSTHRDLQELLHRRRL